MSQPSTGKSVLAGMMTVLLCNLAIALGLILLIWLSNLVAISAIQPLLTMPIYLIGITQLLYAVPMCIKLRRRGHFDEAKGAVIGMVITALLNGSCFIFLFWMISTL